MDDKIEYSEGIAELSFFRKIIVGSLATLHNRLVYPTVEDGKLVVNKVPIAVQYSSRQWFIDNHELKDFENCDPKFLNGAVEKIPSGILIPSEFTMLPDDAINDNIAVIAETISDDDGKTKHVRTRIKYVPVSMTLTLKIRTNTLNQALLIAESMIEVFDDTMEFSVKHLGINKIIAQIKKEEAIGVQRKTPLTYNDSSGYVELEYSLTCITNFPKLNRFSRYSHLIESGQVNIDPK